MTRVWVLTVMTALVVGLTTTVGAQLTPPPGPDHTLTVTVTGTATAPPDWVEVNLPISASGASAEAALMAAQDMCERMIAALLKSGIRQEQIRSTVAQISVAAGQLWEQPQAGGPGLRYGAGSMVRVRLSAQSDDLYGDICHVLDAAGTAGTGSAPGAPGSVNVMVLLRGPGESVTFGANDRDALTAAALANALKQAAKVAQVAAKEAGKTLGELLSLQLLPPSESGPLAVVGMLGNMNPDPESAGKAVVSVTVSATYRLQ